MRRHNLILWYIYRNLKIKTVNKTIWFKTVFVCGCYSYCCGLSQKNMKWFYMMFILWFIFTFKENLLVSIRLFLYWYDIKVIITKYIIWYSWDVYSVLLSGDQSSLCYPIFGNSCYWRKSIVLPFDILPTENI